MSDTKSWYAVVRTSFCIAFPCLKVRIRSCTVGTQLQCFLLSGYTVAWLSVNSVLCMVLYTGTQLYSNTGLVASISQPVFPLLSIRCSFWYIFSPKYFKIHEVYVFWGFILFWTVCFRSFAQVWVCRNSREFKRFPLEMTWRKAFLLAFAQ